MTNHLSNGDGLRDDIVVPGITALRHVTRGREGQQWAEVARQKENEKNYFMINATFEVFQRTKYKTPVKQINQYGSLI